MRRPPPTLPLAISPTHIYSHLWLNCLVKQPEDGFDPPERKAQEFGDRAAED